MIITWITVILQFLGMANPQAPVICNITAGHDAIVEISLTQMPDRQWITVLPETAVGETLHCDGYLARTVTPTMDMHPLVASVYIPIVEVLP